MQKPTIEVIKMEDLGFDVNLVIDTNGVTHYYCGYGVARDFYQSERAKWMADQKPQVLFESETIKVMKFADDKQFVKWWEKEDNHKSVTIDYNVPTLIEYRGVEEGWWATHNITTDLIQAVQSVNVAKVKQAENYRSDKCECGRSVDYDDNFCSECGKKLIKEVE